jgi:hypothetical protein
MFGILLAQLPTHAEKVLMYDEERGIIFVDKETGKPVDQPLVVPKPKQLQTTPAAEQPAPAVTHAKQATGRGKLSKPMPAIAGSDIHTGRKKDPSEIYFESGIEYFKNKDFSNAIKNFEYAD